MSPNDLPAYMAHVGAAARAAATAMAAASTAAKDDALRRLAALLREHTTSPTPFSDVTAICCYDLDTLDICHGTVRATFRHCTSA